MKAPALLLAATLAACSSPLPVATNTTAVVNGTEEVMPSEESGEPMETGGSGIAPLVADWTGKWTGPEGLSLDIAPGESANTRKLRIALLDGVENYVGTVEDNNTIIFKRAGKTERIFHGSGDNTGLKWLAAKEDCLIIASGEGFCRD